MLRSRFHGASVATNVWQGVLSQYEAHSYEDGRLFAIASAMGPPRLWRFALDATLEGLAEGLARPHDGSVTSRLHQGLDGARKRLRERTSMLIERRVADVTLLALGLDGPLLHVLCVGPSRAFLRREKKLLRLSPQEDRAEGLLRAAPAFCAETLVASDLIIAGSTSACSESALAELHAALEARRVSGPEEVVALLNGNAAERGLGAASVALWIDAS